MAMLMSVIPLIPVTATEQFTLTIYHLGGTISVSRYGSVIHNERENIRSSVSINYGANINIETHRVYIKDRFSLQTHMVVLGAYIEKKRYLILLAGMKTA